MSVTELMQKHIPRSWQDETKAALRGVLYQLYTVSESSQEFAVVSAQMRQEGFTVTSVLRLQNVTMFGRYLLRHQQLSSRHPGKQLESQRYVVIDQDAVNTLGTYNVDPRRLELKQDDFHLYSSPTEANKAHMFVNPVMVVCRVSREGDLTTFDSEIYPEYVLCYRR